MRQGGGGVWSEGSLIYRTYGIVVVKSLVTLVPIPSEVHFIGMKYVPCIRWSDICKVQRASTGTLLTPCSGRAHLQVYIHVYYVGRFRNHKKVGDGQVTMATVRPVPVNDARGGETFGVCGAVMFQDGRPV